MRTATPQWKMIQRLALIATLITCVVIILGAYTRLADAGLGCPDWPGCYGHLTWPSSTDAIAKAEARFPEFVVDHQKTWPEMVHRYAASTLGLVILGLFIFTWRSAILYPHYFLPRLHTLLLLVVVIAQGLFGMWTVTLKLWPQVVTLHLLGGFTTLTLLWLLFLRTRDFSAVTAISKKMVVRTRLLAYFCLALVILQIALGGWTSANYAALACTDFPTCHGQWFPSTDFKTAFNFSQTIGPNYLGGLLEGEARTAIHIAHRLGALFLSICLLVLICQCFKLSIFYFKKLALFIAIVLVVQLSLGISNVLASLPLPVAVAHNAMGAVLLLSIATLCYRLSHLGRSFKESAE